MKPVDDKNKVKKPLTDKEREQFEKELNPEIKVYEIPTVEDDTPENY